MQTYIKVEGDDGQPVEHKLLSFFGTIPEILYHIKEIRGLIKDRTVLEIGQRQADGTEKVLARSTSFGDAVKTLSEINARL